VRISGEISFILFLFFGAYFRDIMMLFVVLFEGEGVRERPRPGVCTGRHTSLWSLGIDWAGVWTGVTYKSRTFG